MEKRNFVTSLRTPCVEDKDGSFSIDDCLDKFEKEASIKDNKWSEEDEKSDKDDFGAK